MFFSTVIFGNKAYDWKMTPTPRSRAGSSVTSLPWRITLPVYGISSPAMIRRMVVLPLPDAPSKTSTSPSATSKLMFSSTLVLPKRLLSPTTLAAAGGGSASDGAGWTGCGINVSLAFTIFSISNFAILVDVEPIACEEQHTEDQKREQREHNRDRVRCFDLPFVEFGEDVERGGLGASGEVSRNENRRTKLADCARESQQRAGHDGAAQRRQGDVPE